MSNTVLGLAIVFSFIGMGHASTFKVIYTFGTHGSSDAALPYAPLAMDNAGHLYGTTPVGGAYGSGTVFELVPTSSGSWKEKILHSFSNGTDGGYPYAGVIFDAQGNIYGTTQQGGITSSSCGSGSCGVVFELVKANNWQETVLYSFTGNEDGSAPAAPLLFDSAGNIYGTAEGGGTFVGCYYGCGVAFELEKSSSGWTEKVLHTFTDWPTDGAYPTAGFIWNGADLLGTTSTGGVGPCCGGYDGGTIFQLSPNSDGTWTESLFYTFCAQTNCADGTTPWGGVVLNNGNMFGTTSNGGATGYGVLYERLTSGSTATKFSFAGTGGENPIGPIVLRQAVVYGATEQGGLTTNTCAPFQNGNGVVYKLSQVSGKLSETVLHSFTGGADGCIPQANLIVDGTGHLYGTTELGGKYGMGIAFEVTP